MRLHTRESLTASFMSGRKDKNKSEERFLFEENTEGKEGESSRKRTGSG